MQVLDVLQRGVVVRGQPPVDDEHLVFCGVGWGGACLVKEGRRVHIRRYTSTSHRHKYAKSTNARGRTHLLVDGGAERHGAEDLGEEAHHGVVVLVLHLALFRGERWWTGGGMGMGMACV